MRAATQRKIVNACARVLCVALALFVLPFAVARGESSGMLRVKLTRLGSPASVTMQADCDYTLAADPAVRIPAGSELTLSAKGGNLTLTMGGRSVGLGASARLRRGGTGTAGMVFLSRPSPIASAATWSCLPPAAPSPRSCASTSRTTSTASWATKCPHPAASKR